MTLGFDDLAAGMRLAGVVADAEVTVVAVEMHGIGSATLTYRTDDGRLGERIIQVDDLAGLAEVSEQRWSFDADGAMFRLASEARRMQQAHLADAFAAVDTSNIDPYPHQIDAVYNRLLTKKPLRFLLADDPGAGKTIMSALLIRELVLRGDADSSPTFCTRRPTTRAGRRRPASTTISSPPGPTCAPAPPTSQPPPRPPSRGTCRYEGRQLRRRHADDCGFRERRR